MPKTPTDIKKCTECQFEDGEHSQACSKYVNKFPPSFPDTLIERENVKYALMEFWSQYQGDNDAESRDRTIEKAVNDLCSILFSIKEAAYEEGYKAGKDYKANFL
jgi:hypothetical protein